MKFNRKEAEFIREVIQEWKNRGYLSGKQAEELENSFEVSAYNWKSIARIAFIAAMASGLVSFIIVLKQDLLVDLFYRLINAPYPLLSLIFALLSVFFFWWGRRRKISRPTRIFTNELIILTGGTTLGAAVAFLGMMLEDDLNHYAPLVLLGAALYFLIGKWLPSLLLWFFGLLSLGFWFGAQTIHWSEDTWCFLGMNFPLRYFIFGILMVFLALGVRRFDWDPSFFQITWFSALLYFFIPLWLLSIFGTYCDWDRWETAPWWEFLPFILLLTAFSGLAIWWGNRTEDLLLRGTGIIFLLLEIYSKFVEHAWDEIHRALFFAILALSFWAIGRRAEYIWSFKHSEDK